jgi:hypothetical protein
VVVSGTGIIDDLEAELDELEGVLAAPHSHRMTG